MRISAAAGRPQGALNHQDQRRSAASSANIFWACLFLVGVVMLLYWPSRTHSFVNYDDKDYVTENLQVQEGLSWTGIRWALTTKAAGNWHPLTWVSHMLDCELYGLQPAGHHFTNILFHAANALLLFGFLVRTTGAFWRSLLVAALFAVHPVRVESVAWIAERKDLLSGFFFLLTIWAYAAYARSASDRTSKWGSAFYGLSLLSFALGLMSKPMLVTLPFVLLLLDYWPLKRFSLPFAKGPPESKSSPAAVQDRAGWRLLLEKIPFFALSVASCLITFIAQRGGGAVFKLESLPVWERVANAFVAYNLYLFKTIVPVGLAAFYPHPGHRPMWAWALALLGLLAVSWLVLRMARKAPFLPVGWFFWLGTLVPVIGLVQVGSQAMADRYNYLPGIGLLIMIVWGCGEIARSPSRVRLALGVAMAAIAAFAVQSRLQLRWWKDGVTLFTRAAAVTPDNAITRFYLGNALADQGQFQRAILHLQKAAELNPRFSRAYTSMAAIETALGNYAQAMALYREALKLQPDFPAAMNNLAWMLATSDDPALRDGKEAVNLANRACALTGYSQPMFLGTLAAAYAETGDFQNAIVTGEKARDLALAAGQRQVAEANAAFVELYRQSKPVRQ